MTERMGRRLDQSLWQGSELNADTTSCLLPSAMLEVEQDEPQSRAATTGLQRLAAMFTGLTLTAPPAQATAGQPTQSPQSSQNDLRILETNEMRMLQWAAGYTLKYKKRNVDIRELFGTCHCSELIVQRRLRWHDKVPMCEADHIMRRTGNRRLGRPRKGWVDCIKQDKLVV
ncbi:hypothetical protein ACOME3_008824 [Neoechinorhynchus agilis]